MTAKSITTTGGKKLISLSECARKLGVSTALISKGTKSGRFKLYKRKVNGFVKPFVNYEECSKIYIVTANNGGNAPKGGGLSDKVTSRGQQQARQKSNSGSLPSGSGGDGDVDNMFDIHTIKLEKERWSAKKEKFNLEVSMGKYILMETITKEFVNMAETLKKSILAIPDRVGPIIAGEKDPHKVRQILIVEFKRSLQGIVTDNITQIEDKQNENIVS